MTPGHRLMICRVSAGLTQQELGEQIGLSFSTVCQLERGYHGFTRHAACLAELLGTTSAYLLHGVGEPPLWDARIAPLMERIGATTLRELLILSIPYAESGMNRRGS